MKFNNFVETYKEFAKDLPWPVFIEELNKSILYVNEVFENIFHISCEEVIGKHFNDVLTFEILKEYIDEINDEKLIDNVIKIDERVYKINSISLKDKDDTVYAKCKIMVDITERVNRENALKIQVSRLRTMIDVIPDVIFLKDENGRFLDYNKEFKKYCNSRGAKEILEKTSLEVFGDKKLVKRFRKDDKYVITTKKIKIYEQHIKDPFGDKIIQEVVKVPVINENGDVYGIVGLGRDITTRKNNEKRLMYLSEVDSLTNLYNRHSFEKKVYELENRGCLPLGIIMGDVNGLKIINDTFGHMEGDQLIINTANILREVCGKYVFRWGGDEFVILLPNADENKCKEIIKKIYKRCSEIKHDYIQISIALGETVKKSKDTDIYKYIKDAEKKVYAKKLVERKSVKNSIINSFKKNLEKKSFETSEHINRVVKYAIEIGKRLNLKASQIGELTIAAQLHDIGEVGIDESILKKPTKLTEEEYEIIKTHSEKGYRIINAVGHLENVAKCVLSHHERWDGKGYPLGLSGEDIPLFSRIISVADSYDVMTSGRPYKKALKHEEAMKEIERCSGTQFDPNIVNEFKLFMENNVQSDIIHSLYYI